MPVVSAIIVAGVNPSGHKRAILKCAGKSITLPSTSPKVDHANLSGDWKQVARDGAQPLLAMVATQLPTMTVQVIAARADGSSVEDIISSIVAMSVDPKNSVTLANFGLLAAGPWRLTDVKVSTVARQFTTNLVTQAKLTLNLTRFVPPPGPTATKKKAASTSTTATKSSSATSSGGSKTKTYVVVGGDTLSRIALKFYGDANDWPKIAKANNLRNPNLIYPGQKLKIPA